MIRPEARATLSRYAEPLAALPLIALGIRGLTSFGLWRWLGAASLALGAFLLLTGLQRARFHRNQSGPGLVETDESQLTYFGPGGGQAMALDMIMVISLIPGPPRAWHLSTALGDTLTIPVDATGTDSLFDAFTSLPGFPTATMLHALNHPSADPITIWTRPKAVIDTTRFSPHP